MTRIKFLFSLILALSFLTSCHLAAPDPGYHAVMVKQPIVFGSGGIVEEAVTEGAVVCVPSTRVIYVQMSPSTQTIKLDDYTTSDNNHVDLELNLLIQVTDAYKLISGFGKNWYEDNVVKKVSDILRDKVLGVRMMQLRGNATIQDSVKNLALNEFREHVEKIGLPIDIHDLLINSIIPPAGILQETENTGIQRQRMKTFQAQEDAEKSRLQVERLKALADQEYKKQMGFNNDQYIKSKALEIYHQVQLNYIDLARTDPDVNLTIVTGHAEAVTNVN